MSKTFMFSDHIPGTELANPLYNNYPLIQMEDDSSSYYYYMSLFLERAERLSNLTSQVADKFLEPILQLLSKELQELLKILVMLKPLSNQQENIRHIKHMAFNDRITGLPNRQFFEIQLGNLIKTVNSDSLFYVIFLDLDGFKQVNDTYGHVKGGDRLLKDIGERIRQNIRTDDIVARYGGDEFLILLHLQENQDLSLVLQRLIAIISEPYYFDNLTLKISVSVGVSKYPHSGQTCEELIIKADEAMYVSKSKGNNEYTLGF